MFVKGYSTTRPSLIDGSIYNYYKTRMIIFFTSIDYSLWKIIADGPIDENDERLASINTSHEYL